MPSLSEEGIEEAFTLPSGRLATGTRKVGRLGWVNLRQAVAHLEEDEPLHIWEQAPGANYDHHVTRSGHRFMTQRESCVVCEKGREWNLTTNRPYVR